MVINHSIHIQPSTSYPPKENVMRILKFRAWNKENKSMITSKHYSVMFNGEIKPPSNKHQEWGIDQFILMQYTGLKDKNGKEIYEGDIVIHHYFHETGTVIWQQSQSRYALEYLSDKKTQELFPIDTAMFEIIGNIHENPELLEVSK
jgi:hypothetical protein